MKKCVSVCVLMSNLIALIVFGPHFIADSKSVTYFLFLHHFIRPHCRVMCIWKYEKMSRTSVCVSVVLWCNECEVRKSEGEILCWH